MMSSGHTRVVSLILVTAMFAAVWSNDRSPALPRRMVVDEIDVPDSVSAIEPLLAGDSVPDAPPVAVPAALGSTPLQVIAAPELVVSRINLDDPFVRHPLASTACSYPIPENITTGTYRVIDNRGEVSTLVVVSADRSDRCKSGGSNHFAVGLGARRWHFIRIESDAPAQPSSVRMNTVSPADVVDAWRYLGQSAWGSLQTPLNAVVRPVSRWLRRDTDVVVGAPTRS